MRARVRNLHVYKTMFACEYVCVGGGGGGRGGNGLEGGGMSMEIGYPTAAYDCARCKETRCKETRCKEDEVGGLVRRWGERC